MLEPISTDRLVLRDLLASDFEAVHAYASDPAVCRFMAWGPNTRDDTRGFIGYAFHKAHWGKGYATESVRAVLLFGFGGLRLHRIWTDCDTENHASAHVLEKVGMRREGTLVESKLKGGSWRSSCIYAMLAGR